MSRSPRSAPRVHRAAAGVALGVVLTVGAALRLAGVGWDDGTHLHPDERFVTMVTSALGRGALKPDGPRAAERLAACRARYPERAGVGPWFDTACSDYAPANVGYAFFPYGVLPLAAVRLAGGALEAMGVTGASGYDGIPTVGRVAATLADLVTLACAYLLGRALGGRRAGLLAAALYALATLPVQLARFYTVDPFAAAFGALALVFATRHVRRGETADAIAFGIAAGLATACKLSLAPLALLLAPMAWLAPPPAWAVGSARKRGLSAVLVLVGGTVAALAVFRVAQPIVFAGPGVAGVGLAPGVLDQLAEIRATMSGSADSPPAWQWIGRTRWLDPLRNLLVFGTGPALAIAATLAIALAAARAVAGPLARRRVAIVLLIATIGYGAWLGAQWVSSMRYWLPLYPALAAFAGWGVVVAARRWRSRRPALRWAPLAFVAIAAVTALAHLSIPLAAPTRVWASAWMLERVPAGISAVVGERDEALPRRVNFAFDGVLPRLPERVRLRTTVGRDGTIERLQLRLDGAAGDLAPASADIAITRDDGRVILARTELATQVAARAPPGFDAGDRVVELALPAPLPLRAGERLDLEIGVRDARLALAGATIATEGAWDDPVPMRHRVLPAGTRVEPGVPGFARAGAKAHGVDPFGQRYFRGVELPLVHPDEAAKRDALVRGLDRAQWLTISSQRFYDAVARDPYRFPLATRYYDALFAGALGFEVVATFRSPPRLGGFALDPQVHPWPDGYLATRAQADASPEEAFSVYDHPPVTVFRRTPAYDGARVRAILAEASLRTLDEARREGPPSSVGRVVRTPAAAQVAPDLLMLPPARERALEARADDDGALGSIGTALAFYVAAALLGAAALPWLAAILPSMPSVAWGLARTAGVFALGAIAWWATWAGLDLWRPGALALVLAAMLAAAALRARRDARALRDIVRGEARRGEIAFAALFCAGLAMRMANPDLWAPGYGGEKAMDLALLNAVMRTDTFPPYDAWFAGGRLNYYYLGFVPVAALAKLAGTPPEIAYNAAMALWLALTGAALFGVGRALATRVGAAAGRATAAGVVSTVAGVALGNLGLVAAMADAAPRGETFVARLASVVTHADARWYWSPTRIVAARTQHGHEIHEFPYFTFLHGDLHAHLLALPLTILCWGVAAALVLDPARRGGARLGAALVLAAATALLRGANSWDWPLFSLVAIVALGLVAARLPGPLARQRSAWVGLLAAFAAAQLVVAWPFAESFVTGGVALRPYTGLRTPLTSWLAIYGLFAWVIVPWLALRGPPMPRPATAPAGVVALVAAGIALAWQVAEIARGAATGTPVAAVGAIAALALLALRVVADRREAPGERALAALVAIAFGVQLVPEFVTVGVDIGRQNTYFKFHLQSWIALALAAGPIALAMLARVRDVAWRTGFAALAAVALAYVPVGFAARAGARFDGERPTTLDGLAFLSTASLHRDGRAWPLDGDRAIVAWLRAHAPRGAIVLEAHLPEYQYGSRIASFAGVRTLLGYRWHETQQRPVVPLGDIVNLRVATIDAIWRGDDLARARRVLAEYRVRYVVVGALERAVYPASALERFDAWTREGHARVVFRHGDSTIYALDAPPAAGWPRL